MESRNARRPLHIKVRTEVRGDSLLHHLVIPEKADRGFLACVELRKIHNVPDAGLTCELNESQLPLLDALR
jgi:hypothetical protein